MNFPCYYNIFVPHFSSSRLQNTCFFHRVVSGIPYYWQFLPNSRGLRRCWAAAKSTCRIDPVINNLLRPPVLFSSRRQSLAFREWTLVPSFLLPFFLISITSASCPPHFVQEEKALITGIFCQDSWKTLLEVSSDSTWTHIEKGNFPKFLDRTLSFKELFHTVQTNNK